MGDSETAAEHFFEALRWMWQPSQVRFYKEAAATLGIEFKWPKREVDLVGTDINPIAVATSSSRQGDERVKIVNGSGLRERDAGGWPEHGIDPADMWLSGSGESRG